MRFWKSTYTGQPFDRETPPKFAGYEEITREEFCAWYREKGIYLPEYPETKGERK